MTKIIRTLDEIDPGYNAVFCDLWGCLHDGTRAFPAAVAALERFRARGGTVLLLTNSPRPERDVAVQLEALGAPASCYDLIVTSGDAAQEAMASGAFGRKVYHIGPERDLGFFVGPNGQQIDVERVPLEEAEGIVCTGLFDDRSETPEDYRATILYGKTKGLKLLCANPDVVVDVGEHRIYCAGAIAKAYTEAGGKSFYFGKPHPPIYDLARRRVIAAGFDFDPARTLAVGDGIGTDIQGGLGEGIDTLFVTGGLAAEAFGPDVEAPEAGLLRDWLDDRQITPTYAIGRLR